MKKLLLLFFVTTCNLYAQCPSKKDLISQIEQSGSLSDQQAIDKLIFIKSKWINCNYPSDSNFAKIHHFIGRRYRYIGNDNQDEKSLQKAIEFTQLATQINSQKKIDISEANLTNSYLNLGLLYSEILIQEVEKSKEYLKKAVEVGLKYKHKAEFTCQAANQLARHNISSGDYESAIKYAEIGKTIAIKIKDDELLFSAVNKISEAYRNLEKYSKAQQELLYITQKIKNPQTNNELIFLAETYANLAILSHYNKNPQQMNIYFQKAYFYNQKANSNYGMAMVKNNWGYLSSESGNGGNALKLYEEGLKIVTDANLKVRILDNISIYYFKKRNYKEADKQISKAISIINNKSFESKPHKIFSGIAKKSYFLDLLHTKSKCLKGLYNQNSNKEYLQNALKTYESADKLIDYMRQEHTGTQSKYFWRNKTRSIYESAIETCFLLKDYQKAFYFFEKSRAVMLNDKINELGAKQTLSENDQQQERKYIKDISELNASIEKEQNQKKKSDLTTQLYTLQEQQDRFIKTLETKNPAYFQLKYDTTIFQLKDIQSYLKKTQINSLFEYFMGDSTTYAIVITPENVALKKLSLKPDNIQQFLEYCSKNISTKTELSALLGYGSSLYQSLIAPLNLPNGRLIISQDGAFIPFEAISKSANSPQYLLKDYAISYTYSAQFLMKNQEKYGFLPNKNFLGAAPINFSSKLNTLQGSEQSLKNIEKNYTFGNLLINQAASRNAFLNEAGKYKIVQLYTHAFADSNDTEPKIYFADSALKVSDLNLTDRFKTNLLILSACKTGVGKVAKGEGVLSLARGFSMAGIRSTITSLWSVEDKDTYKLTELFHHYLNEGLPKDEALRQAKLEFIEHNENVNPYSWAGFILIGDSSEISTSNWIIWALAVFLITSLTLIFAKKLFSKK